MRSVLGKADKQVEKAFTQKLLSFSRFGRVDRRSKRPLRGASTRFRKASGFAQFRESSWDPEVKTGTSVQRKAALLRGGSVLRLVRNLCGKLGRIKRI